jgi:hypothetical protein
LRYGLAPWRELAVEFKQVDAGALAGDDFRKIAVLSVDREELAGRCSLSFQEGPDRTQEAVIQVDDRFHARLLSPLDSSRAPSEGAVEVQLSQGAEDKACQLDETLVALGLSSEQIEWLEPDLEFRSWAVWLKGPASNLILVDTLKCRADAELRLAERKVEAPQEAHWIAPTGR